MSNPIFNMMSGQAQANPLMQRLRQFQQTLRGDPRQQVQQMLNSGRVSQDQYNRAVQMAQQLQRMLGIR